MSIKNNSTHILGELARQRIPIFDERGAENNKQILRSIATNGSMLKYDVSKKTKIARYSTVSRRIDDLVNRGYLGEAGTRVTQRGKQTEEPMYGLTWKGFVACITIENMRKEILQVLEINPLLAFPEKELILPLVQEIAEPQEIETFVCSFLKVLLESIPNLELVDDKQMPILIMSALTKIRLPKDFKLSRIPEDAWELLDKPAIFQVVKEKIVPFLKQYADSIKAMYQLVSAFEGFDKLFYELDAKNQPSKKVKEFIETRVHNLSRKNPEMLKNEGE